MKFVDKEMGVLNSIEFASNADRDELINLAREVVRDRGQYANQAHYGEKLADLILSAWDAS